MEFLFSYINRNGGVVKQFTGGIEFEVKNLPHWLFGSIILLVFFLNPTLSNGQASVPTDTQAMVESQVNLELNEWVKSEDFQAILQNHPNASGILSLELSIYNRGQVRSVFQLESTIDDVPFRNTIKNRVKEFKFDLKKMDKKTTQKVVYTFNIE